MCHAGSRTMRLELNRVAPLNDPDQHNDNGNDEKNVYEIAHGVAAHHSQQPQNMYLLCHGLFPLMAIACLIYPAAQWTLDRFLVYTTLLIPV